DWLFLLCYFFFQAEDGIRDGHVTGVQTCALPIYIVIDRTSGYIAYTVVSTGGEGTGVTDGGGKIVAVPWAVYSPTSDLSVVTVRSEERRVGKEGSTLRPPGP